MAKFGEVNSYSLLGIISIAVGALILVLAFLNYLQDGKISVTTVIGFMAISVGLILYSRNK